MKNFLFGVAATVAAVTMSNAAMATTTIYFGENQNPNGGVSGDPVTARASFLSALGGVNTESFEGFPVGDTPPLTLAFTGSSGTINANLSGGGSIDGSPTTGAYATSGSNYYDNLFNSFTIDFSTPVAAFGFYGTDIGDVGASLTIQVVTASGMTTRVIPNTVNGNNGSLLFYGLIDTADPFTSIIFNQSGSDRFGFDDMTIGDAKQVINDPASAVPEPSVWAMMMGGIGLMGAALRRRKPSGVLKLA